MATRALADLAFVRTFGFRPPTPDEPEIAFEGRKPDGDEPLTGTAQPVAIHVLARDGNGIPGATVTLLNDHGRETANTCTTSDGHGVLTVRPTGGYMLVATYRFRDLSLGDYGLSVSAHEREPAALVVEIADEANLCQDVVLHSGLSSADVMVGPR
jgi:hypothetical protein